MTKKEEVNTQKTTDEFKLTSFFRETKEELDKVVWPSRQQLISESAAVVSMVILSAIVISSVDKLFSWIATRVF